MARLTIREFAREFFVKVHFVDVHGRDIGYDYSYILDKIKARFPASRTSRKWVRQMASTLNASERLPIRGRINRSSAHSYAMSLLVSQPEKVSYLKIRALVTKSFPPFELTLDDFFKLEKRLHKLGLKTPHRVPCNCWKHG